MRKKWDEQLSIWHYLPKNRICRELTGISEILDAHPVVLESVFKDLSKAQRIDTGRDGMTAEQVLRCAVLKQYRNLTYEELEFHLQDSWSLETCWLKTENMKKPAWRFGLLPHSKLVTLRKR